MASVPACGGSAVQTTEPAAEPDPRASEYTIGASDELDIQVWKNAGLNTKITVRPDGFITMPLIGDQQAAGLTPSELREEVARRLSAYLRDGDATVTVAVVGVNSYHVTVAGNVATPGRYASAMYLTVSDAIALAGGPTRFADAEDTVVLRRKGGKVRRIPVDYEGIIQGEREGENLVLVPGDVVFVP
jgi:polysaccharide export outer membrane protein